MNLTKSYLLKWPLPGGMFSWKQCVSMEQLNGHRAFSYRRLRNQSALQARSQLALVGDTILSLATSLHLIRQHPFLSTVCCLLSICICSKRVHNTNLVDMVFAC